MARKGGKRASVLRGEEKRQVRTIRATDTTWNRIMQEAELNGYSAGDLLEEFAKKIKRPPAQEDAIPNEILRSLDPTSSPKDNPEQVEKAIALLTEALALKANAGGAIKSKIRGALQLLS